MCKLVEVINPLTRIMCLQRAPEDDDVESSDKQNVVVVGSEALRIIVRMTTSHVKRRRLTFTLDKLALLLTPESAFVTIGFVLGLTVAFVVVVVAAVD